MNLIPWRRRPDPDDEQRQRIQDSQAQLRAYAAEDATRAISTRLEAALDRDRLARAERDKARAEAAQLRDRIRELGSEVAALRVLLERAQAPRGAAQRCPDCKDPMPAGFAHFCRRNSTYTEEAAAA